MGLSISVTPTLDTSIYASGDRLGSVMTIQDPSFKPGLTYMLDEVVIVDGSKQSVAIDIMIFSDLPTVASADNAAIDISAAEMAKFQSSVSLLNTSYKALASVSYVTGSNLGIAVKSAGRALYALMVVRSGTPTYTASALTLTFKFRKY